jgi:hypothetical protein
MKRPKAFKVWVWPEAVAHDLREGGTASIHPRRAGFKRRVKATLILAAPPKKRKRK